MLRSLLLAATLLTPVAVQAQGVAGPYLAARIAGFSNDYRAAGAYYARLLRAGDAEPQVLENAIIINAALGDFDAAVAAADALTAQDAPTQFGNAARMVVALRDERWDDADALLEGEGVGGALLDGLLGAWIQLGSGDVEAAVATFGTLAETESFAPYARQQEALALAVTGDYAGADEILSGRAHGPLGANARLVVAHVQVLSQLGRTDDARDLLRQANDLVNNPRLESLADRLDAGEAPAFDLIADAREGAGEAYFTLAALLTGESSTTFTLINARAALVLAPGHVDAAILTADLLEEQDQHALAGEILATVPEGDPSFFAVEIARSEVLMNSDREAEAADVLAALTESHGERAEVWIAYANALRLLERFADAVPAYDRAIEMQDEITARDGFLLYARGVAREQTDDWPGAESDFRRALELIPEEPNVLNYLGYGLVEQRMKLDEALDLIERAVAARPQDGYITDSLGWVFYRLGRYEDAVAPMERAVELRPLDPLINDHLGDVYWTVGRKREAEFQWRRALSFDPETEEARIRRKLEVGLDVVLEDEGGADEGGADEGATE